MAQSTSFIEFPGKIVKMAPNFDRIIVDPYTIEGKKIYVPQSVKERHAANVGRIMAIGRSTGQFPFDFEVGDWVVFSRYSGIAIVQRQEGVNVVYQILHFQDVQARVTFEEEKDNGADRECLQSGTA